MSYNILLPKQYSFSRVKQRFYNDSAVHPIPRQEDHLTPDYSTQHIFFTPHKQIRKMTSYEV